MLQNYEEVPYKYFRILPQQYIVHMLYNPWHLLLMSYNFIGRGQRPYFGTLPRCDGASLFKTCLRFVALTVAGIDAEHLQTWQQQFVIQQVLFQQIYSHIQSPVQSCFNAKLPVCRGKQAKSVIVSSLSAGHFIILLCRQTQTL